MIGYNICWYGTWKTKITTYNYSPIDGVKNKSLKMRRWDVVNQSITFHKMSKCKYVFECKNQIATIKCEFLVRYYQHFLLFNLLLIRIIRFSQFFLILWVFSTDVKQTLILKASSLINVFLITLNNWFCSLNDFQWIYACIS